MSRITVILLELLRSVYVKIHCYYSWVTAVRVCQDSLSFFMKYCGQYMPRFTIILLSYCGENMSGFTAVLHELQRSVYVWVHCCLSWVTAVSICQDSLLFFWVTAVRICLGSLLSFMSYCGQYMSRFTAVLHELLRSVYVWIHCYSSWVTAFSIYLDSLLSFVISCGQYMSRFTAVLELLRSVYV